MLFRMSKSFIFLLESCDLVQFWPKYRPKTHISILFRGTTPPFVHQVDSSWNEFPTHVKSPGCQWQVSGWHPGLSLNWFRVTPCLAGSQVVLQSDVRYIATHIHFCIINYGLNIITNSHEINIKSSKCWWLNPVSQSILYCSIKIII